MNLAEGKFSWTEVLLILGRNIHDDTNSWYCTILLGTSNSCCFWLYVVLEKVGMNSSDSLGLACWVSNACRIHHYWGWLMKRFPEMLP